jgi:hypothetical protein
VRVNQLAPSSFLPPDPQPRWTVTRWTERLAALAFRQSGHSQDDRDCAHFKRAFREPVYETLFGIARENLHVQDTVIVGAFTRQIKDPGWRSKLP